MSQQIIPVGAEFIITAAEVTLLTGEVLRTADIREFAERVIDGHKVERPGEIPPDPIYVRQGYQAVSFFLEGAGFEPFTLRFGQCEFKQWKELVDDGVVIEGEHTYVWSFNIQRIHPAFQLPGNGQKLGECLLQIAGGQATHCLIKQGSVGNPCGHDDYVVLVIRPSLAAFAEGSFDLIRDNRIGETYSAFYQMEGGDSDYGRGDHVGAAWSRRSRR